MSTARPPEGAAASAQALDVFRCPLEGVRLIEASAGTGKTWNICGLYLRLVIEHGLEVQKILVVTFTKAATAELAERIRDRLTEVLATLDGRAPATGDPFAAQLLQSVAARGFAPQAVRALLERAIRNFDEAAIFTIHGFCKRALDDTPLASGMPLRQELLEDDRELRREAAHDFWRRQLAGGSLPPALVRYMVLEKDTPARLVELLGRHAGKSTAELLWPPGSQALPAVDLSDVREAFARARAIWLAQRAEVVQCVLDSLESLNATSYKAESVAESAQLWDAVFASADPMGCPPRPADSKLKLLTARWYASRRKAKAPRECLTHPFFDAAQALADAWAAVVPALQLGRMHVLRRFVETVPAELRERKRSRRFVAFDDMLFNLRERLPEGAGGEALACALRERFPAALIDEFQDTDPLQFAIFDRVYRAGGTLFLVGDPKQAIYSFRNADLHTYLAAARSAASRYSLAENQRSSQALIGALNALFGANERAFMLDGLAYEPVRFGQKRRKPFEDYTSPRAALQLWQLPATPEGPLDKGGARRAATLACAAEVARLLEAARGGQVLHDGQPLRASHIAVLVRSHREGSEMRAALAALGVGSVELAQTSVFETPDAEEVERVLAAILEPAREGLLRAALATQLLGHDAAAIEAMSHDEVRLAEAAARMRELREVWAARGVGPMLRELALREGVAGRMLARSDGERRLTNFRHLSECLHEASLDHHGPQALLRWFRLQRAENRSEAAQVRLESDQNLVQIVTIHKSKGLEYPVVFCPYLWDGGAGGRPSSLPGREYHDDEGRVVIDYRDLDDEAARDIGARIEVENDAERLRLVYVALTRAVHRCYLVVGAYTARRSTNESGCNPFNWLVAGQGLTPAQWRAAKNPPAVIEQAWQRLAADHPDAIRLDPLPPGPGRPVTATAVAAESLEALPPPARMPRGWQLASYSSLAHGATAASGEAPAADRDAQDGRAAARALPPEDLPAADILRFPRGARAGDSLHAVFERIDFNDPAQWPDRIAQAIRARPPGGIEPALAQAMLLGMARDVLGTPLPDGIVLSRVRRRIVELEFTLHAPDLSLQALARSMREAAYPPITLEQKALAGYLRGFIDLVFEHAGRFYIADWKSNYLGHRPGDYGRAALDTAMRDHGYHLQYLLYTVAVHRWLRARVAGYDYDTHFGQVLYLFVRGVRPAWTLPDGSAAGVYADRPPRALVEQLDALLAGERSVA